MTHKSKSKARHLPSAIALIRNGGLVPLLLEHMTDRYHMFIYYGSRQAQPGRVRRFIDLAVDRPGSSSDYVLSREELAAAGNL